MLSVDSGATAQRRNPESSPGGEYGRKNEGAGVMDSGFAPRRARNANLGVFDLRKGFHTEKLRRNPHVQRPAF